MQAFNGVIPAAMQHRVVSLGDGEIQTFVSGSKHFLSAATPAWAGFPIEEGMGLPEPLKRATAIRTTLIVCGKQDDEVKWTFRGSNYHERMSPGSFFILRCGVEITEISRNRTCNRSALMLDTERLVNLGGVRGARESGQLMPTVFGQNKKVAELVRLMKSEIKAGCPNGPLYAESLSIALISLLRARYSETCQSFVDHRTLSPKEAKRVVDYIMENLSESLSVTQLAELVHLSPDHFSRLFKVTFGSGPYEYVLMRRIEKAKIMMDSLRCPLLDIALSVGFSSHTHFSKTFRNLVGISPAEYRRLC